MRTTMTKNNNIMLNIPSLEKQKEITDILTNIDNEIKQAEEKLAELKDKKLTLMEELLAN